MFYCSKTFQKVFLFVPKILYFIVDFAIMDL